jgi:uncharacterized protein YegJ (DUF2314 family)
MPLHLTHRLAGLALGLVILAFTSESRPAVAQSGGIVGVPSADAAVKIAQAKARASLPDFWKALQKPSPGEEKFSLKVGMSTGGRDSEHIWVNAIERLSDSRFAGRLNNDPRDIEGRKSGDRVEFDEAQISDWMFMRNGKIVGNETMRPLLEHMPEDVAARYRALLEKP